MKSFIKPLAVAVALAGCAKTNEDVLNMPADEYFKAVASHLLAKVETVQVSLAAVEKSFKNAAASCLKQRHEGHDVPGGVGYVVVDHVSWVYRDGSGVVLEIRQSNNGKPRRIFLAKARATSGGTAVAMGRPKLAHDLIFKHVGGYEKGRGGCFRYPSETGMLGMF